MDRSSKRNWYILAIFCGVCIAVVVQNASHPTASYPSQIANVAAQRKANIIDKLDLRFVWDRQGFGTVMNVDFKITNNNDVAVKDVEVECRQAGNSGTVISTNVHTLYDVVQPHQTKKFNTVNMGFINQETTGVACHATDVSLDE